MIQLHIGLFSIALIATLQLHAQDPKQELDAVTGTYRLEASPTQLFKIKREKDKLLLEVEQWQTILIPLGSNRYKPEGVQRPTIIEFIKDSLGRVQTFKWIQDINTELERVSDSSHSNSYTGRYKAKDNPYLVVDVTEVTDSLIIRQANSATITMHALSRDHFIYEKEGLKMVYEFTRNGQGVIEAIKFNRTGPLVLMRMTDADAKAEPYTGQVFTDNHPFNRADSLRGMLTPVRTCYDVLFYALNVRVMPETKSITGSTLIRFRAVQAFNTMQVDLFANMRIDKILFHDRPLSYTREYNAVFINFPKQVKKGTEDSIIIFYEGQPRQPDLATMQGGFFWLQDKNGNPWIESVCQGSGASLWWPCKDHLSDKPDSMRISITVPDTLMDISNGTLQRQAALPGHLMRYDWYVQYPITNYDVVVNIGKYAHHTEPYSNDSNSMPLHYYYLPYHADIAKHIFKAVKPMLILYEKEFGPYPFKKDGFTIMESLYPMEHQGAVSVGSFSNPLYSDQYDTADVIRLAWHETAHEWWGNSVTCKDMADLWIHEAFATYAEILCYNAFNGSEAALKYVREQVPGNKESLIGRYDVNDFHLGDIYSKGARMLHTLQQVINNDTLWFSLLKSIQQQFRYRSVTTEDIVLFINKTTGKDFTAFFDQYLRHTALPELMLILKQEGDSLEVQYKWKADVPEFNMPVTVTTAKDRYTFIYPTTQWQSIRLAGMQPGDFKADTDHFLITVTKQ